MSKIKYMYVRNDFDNRDITIVSDLIETGGKYKVKCAWTFRNKKDKFIKKEGRKIAFERMQNNDANYSASFEIEKSDINFYNIATKILEQVMEHKNTPKSYLNDIYLDKEYYSYYTLTGIDRYQQLKERIEKYKFV